MANSANIKKFVKSLQFIWSRPKSSILPYVWLRYPKDMKIYTPFSCVCHKLHGWYRINHISRGRSQCGCFGSLEMSKSFRLFICVPIRGFGGEAPAKGQLISKCPYEKSVSSKIPTKIFLDFCPEIIYSFLGISW